MPDLGDLPYADEVVYLGGPVQPEAVVVLVELDEPRDDARADRRPVAYMPPGVDTWELPASRARVFAGYSGWGPGQLEAELEEPAWIVAPRRAGRRLRCRPRRALARVYSSARAACTR